MAALPLMPQCMSACKHALFYVVLFIMLYKVRRLLFSRLWMEPQCVATKMKAIKYHFHMALLIALYNVILTIFNK